MKSSTTSRSLKLLSLAAKVGSSELAQAVKSKFRAPEDRTMDSRMDQAKWIAENLAQLKGAAMKVGQLLSIDSADYFPPEAMAILSKLQASAEPVDFEIMREVLVEDLGEKKLGDFDDLDRAPAASASIGQVHRAKLNGNDVAIKIQYPGVSTSVDSDLKILRGLATTFLGASGRTIDLTPLFSELARVLKQEADYENERASMNEFRERLKGDDRYRVPEAYPDYSSKRVLTMSWQAGANLDSWLRSRPDQARREKLAKSMLELFCWEFFDWGLVQTDPNFANFLIGERDALVMLDFGAVIRYEEEFRNRYRGFLAAMGTLDEDTIVREGIHFGLISDRESDEAKTLFSDLMKLSIEPFQSDRQPFKFDDSDYTRRQREAGTAFAKALRHSPPPQRILFLHRRLGGMFNFVKRLDVAIDLTPFWRLMTA